MAFQAVPDTFEIKVFQSIAGVAAPQNTWFFRNPTVVDLTQTLANTLGELIEGRFETDLQSHLSTAWSLTKIQITDLRTEGAPQFDAVFDALSGTDGADLLATQTCALINWRTAVRTRNFRGKSYLSGFSEAQSNGSPTAACLTALNAFATNLIADFHSAAPSDLVVVSRFDGSELVPARGGQTVLRPKRRPGDAQTFAMTTGAADLHWHTQRRRGQPG